MEKKKAGIDYTYIEIDPYKKPEELTDISPKGLVPVSSVEICVDVRSDETYFCQAMRLNNGGSLHDSMILMHYLSTLPLERNPLLPQDPYNRAKHLLSGQKHAETITPAFYRYLQAQDAEKQVEYGK
jgi:glutathione S-transferase